MSGSTTPDITIFIRARNEAALLGECLKTIFAQETSHSFEVVLLDCESTDRTVEIAKEYPVKIYSIPSRLFSYSSALNFGATVARGNLFVPLSAHVVPADNHWLQELVEPVAKGEVAASFSRQVPWPTAAPQEQASIAKSYPETDKIVTRESFCKEVALGTSAYNEIAFSNASSCILSEHIENIGFLEMPFSEDRAFAVALLQGRLSYKYCSRSVCYHSHPPSFREYRSIAKAATLSQNYLERMIASALSVSVAESSQGVAELLFKLIVISGWGAFAYALSRLGVIAKESGDFYLASIGTTLGKFEAAVSAPLANMERASTEVIEREVKELS
ncbi:MAG: glycosyltransferase [Bdellovibrionales bacterium]|nr:glycosyltransferase [Bdellovibrionales bacterium]